MFTKMQCISARQIAAVEVPRTSSSLSEKQAPANGFIVGSCPTHQRSVMVAIVAVCYELARSFKGDSRSKSRWVRTVLGAVSAEEVSRAVVIMAGGCRFHFAPCPSGS